MTIFEDDIKKHWIRVTTKEIEKLINHQTFLVQESEKYEYVTSCMVFLGGGIV